MVTPSEHQFAPEFPGSQRENMVVINLCVGFFCCCFLRKEDTHQILRGELVNIMDKVQNTSFWNQCILNFI